jgi:1,6-anhydro-N-acetylmuramate kinase
VFKNHQAFRGRNAARKLVQQRFLLEEDLPAITARGQREWDEVNGQR